MLCASGGAISDQSKTLERAYSLRYQSPNPAPVRPAFFWAFEHLPRQETKARDKAKHLTWTLLFWAITNADRMAPAPPSVAPESEEVKVLADALNTVKIQVVQMKRYLVSSLSAEPK